MKYYLIGSYVDDSNYNMNLFVRATNKRAAGKVFSTVSKSPDEDYMYEISDATDGLRSRFHILEPTEVSRQQLIDEWEFTPKDFEELDEDGWRDAGSGT